MWKDLGDNQGASVYPQYGPFYASVIHITNLGVLFWVSTYWALFPWDFAQAVDKSPVENQKGVLLWIKGE